MIPWTFSDGPAPVKTYKDFQGFSLVCRESALKWLRGRTNQQDIVMDMITMNRAANDQWPEDIGPLVAYYEYVMMLYCWVENNRDDVQTKLAYVEGRQYQPLTVE